MEWDERADGEDRDWSIDRFLSDMDQLQKENIALHAEVERLREERRWIPVSERLPDDEVNVICGYAHFKSFPGFRRGFNWFDERDSHLMFPPTHWQPLPAPPEKEEE